MASTKFINISYPFKDSPKGFFLDLTSDDQRAVKSDLLYLLLSRKGQRYYNPDFGTDLMKFIFEPNDTLTLNDVKEEISNSVNKYIPNLTITNLSVTPSDDSDYAAVVRLDYTISDNVFDIVDFVVISV